MPTVPNKFEVSSVQSDNPAGTFNYRSSSPGSNSNYLPMGKSSPPSSTKSSVITAPTRPNGSSTGNAADQRGICVTIYRQPCGRLRMRNFLYKNHAVI